MDPSTGVWLRVVDDVIAQGLFYLGRIHPDSIELTIITLRFGRAGDSFRIAAQPLVEGVFEDIGLNLPSIRRKAVRALSASPSPEPVNIVEPFSLCLCGLYSKVIQPLVEMAGAEAPRRRPPGQGEGIVRARSVARRARRNVGAPVALDLGIATSLHVSCAFSDTETRFARLV